MKADSSDPYADPAALLSRLGLKAAHDLNNLIAVVSGNAYLMRAGGTVDSESLRAIEGAVAGLERLSKSLSAVGTAHGPRTAVDVNALVREVAAAAGAPVPELDLADGLPPVAASPDAIRAALRALLENARAATKGAAGTAGAATKEAAGTAGAATKEAAGTAGAATKEAAGTAGAATPSAPQGAAGTARPRTAPAPHGAAGTAGPAGTAIRTRRDGDAVVLSVEDRGPGIPADAANRAFEPFFSTRGGGRGTGIGLFLAAAVASAHGGSCRLEERPGGGTAASIRLRIA
ncbi:MAG TPA: sensor histidine kinase [Thermoanaerobaculia bacterium]|nr:sensor histidine kinase [Thermoanaerobaculia bacterium]